MAGGGACHPALTAVVNIRKMTFTEVFLRRLRDIGGRSACRRAGLLARSDNTGLPIQRSGPAVPSFPVTGIVRVPSVWPRCLGYYRNNRLIALPLLSSFPETSD